MPEFTCGTCHETKPASEFYQTTNQRGGTYYTTKRCKLCRNAASAEYKRNQVIARGGVPRAVRAPGDMTAAERRALVRLVANAIGCADCGARTPDRILHFDHLPQFEKSFNIVWAANRLQLVSDRRLLEEMLKCDVVCTICHNRRSWERRRAGIVVVLAADTIGYPWASGH